jgi:hypothetical protein
MITHGLPSQEGISLTTHCCQNYHYQTHREHLQKRGLSDVQIVEVGYKTFPTNGRATVIRCLVNAGFHMAGVPGFYFENSDVKLSGVTGFLLPVTDVQGMINGLQIRSDRTEGGKYRWLSSSGETTWLR